MKLVTTIGTPAGAYGYEKAVELIGEAGFDGIDFSLFGLNKPGNALDIPDYIGYVRSLNETAKKYSMKFEQSHAPFPSFIKGKSEYNDLTFKAIVKSLEISGELGIYACVVHPTYFGRKQFDFNIDYYNRLLPYAKEYNVKIAVENMWGNRRDRNLPHRKLQIGFNAMKNHPVPGYECNIRPNVCSIPDDFNRYVDALDSEYFTACLDLGHCGLVGEDCATMIRAMGSDRITCLHIHDNDMVHDSHTLPYTMRMDWDSILQALADIDYKGNFTYEADNFLRQFPTGLYGSALKFMADTGSYMMGEIERKKSQHQI